MADFKFKEKYNVYDLTEIVKALRSENGCPWDKEQTHASIRNNFLEEVYEVMEAIDLDNVEMMREELGDVLLQVVFHSVMETEKGSFDLDDVADEVCKKLIERHPHVFGTVKVNGTNDVLTNWENIKQKSKGQESYTDTLNSVPKVFPALMRGQKLSKRAARAGFELMNIEELTARIADEASGLKSACLNGNGFSEEQLGALLFDCCAAARLMGIDAEEALQRENERFIEKFSAVEELTRLDGIDMKSLSKYDLKEYIKKVEESK